MQFGLIRVIRVFTVIGEEVGKLSEGVTTIYEQINWQKIYSLRNIIAHHYFGINVDPDAYRDMANYYD